MDCKCDGVPASKEKCYSNAVQVLNHIVWGPTKPSFKHMEVFNLESHVKYQGQVQEQTMRYWIIYIAQSIWNFKMIFCHNLSRY